MTNKFKIEAFFNQFRFISEIQTSLWEGRPDDWCATHGCTADRYHEHPLYINMEDVEEVLVSRVSAEFLQTRPWYKSSSGDLVGVYDSERIFLLNGQGAVLLEVEQSVDHIPMTAHVDPEYTENETVGEALLRLEDPDQVVYALKVHTGYTVEDHYSVGGYRITLYKPPKGFTLRGWVEEQLRRAATQLSAQIAEIDAEGLLR